jgi:hypothetical protein
MPFEQALPIAEAFLQQTGLADFEYRLISPNGFDIEVHRMVDGREAIFSEMLLAVNSDGEVWSFSYNPLSGLAALGDYPLRSAEAAWQYMLDNGVDFQTVFFNSYPAENPVEQPQPVEEDFRYWQRRFEPGAEVTLYSYPGVFTAVNGDAAPRITLDLFILNGETDQLEAIAGYVGKQILVQGIAGEVVGNRQVLELVSWEPIEKEFTFIEGVVALNDGQSTLTTDEGVTYIIPDAPENLFDGDRVYINGWVEEDGQEQENIFNWQGISVVFDPQIDVEGEPEPLPIDGELVNPFGIKEVIIDQVDLQYAVLSVWDEETQTSTFTLQPVWQYKGVTDSGDLIDIYVQAAAAEYVNSTAR